MKCVAWALPLLVIVGVASSANASTDMDVCVGQTAAIERIGACSRAIESGLSGDELIKAHTARGIAYGRVGQIDSGLEDLGVAIKAAPDKPGLWIARARLHFNKGEHDPAMLDLAEAIKLDAKNALPVNLMGQNHFMLGNYDIALKFFDQAIAMDPNDYNAFVNRATTYYRTNKLPDALRDVNAAYLILPPGDSRARGLVELKRAIESAYASQQGAQPAASQ